MEVFCLVKSFLRRVLVYRGLVYFGVVCVVYAVVVWRLPSIISWFTGVK